jgi:hypothetical protein
MTRFLSNDGLWAELKSRVKTAKRVKAAVAYLGQGGARLLPLKKGDTLVVNLGLQTVKQGATSPEEIQKLINRGVRVFTRSNLHAKFFICDNTLIVGSANISQNSLNSLDEAASLTNDPEALRHARDFFEKLSKEPVRPEYLERCLKAYRPPRFSPPRSKGKTRRQPRVVESNLWFIGGVAERDLPAKEQKTAAAIEEKTTEELEKHTGTWVSHLDYTEKPAYFDKIRVGDWFVVCLADAHGHREIQAPRQVLGHESYPRGGGKRRYLLMCEVPDAAEAVPLEQFRRYIRKFVPKLDADRPRTKPILDREAQTAIFKLWTPSGRISKGGKRKRRRP